MRRLMVVGLAVLLAGCGTDGSPSTGFIDVPPTVVPSATSVPPTPIVIGEPPVTLEDFDPGWILNDEDDLPAGFFLNPESNTAKAFRDVFQPPIADLSMTQEYERRQHMTGYASIGVYGAEASPTEVYEHILAGVGSEGQPVAALGDQATQRQIPVTPTSRSTQFTIVFVRCQAVVFIESFWLKEFDPSILLRWAQQIDKRIQNSPVCAK